MGGAADPLAAASAQQRQAADPGLSVFVTANAGSGKTKVLIDRIARLLLAEGADPSQFLCITYTKAAAAEMQRRLFERLGGWSVRADAALASDIAALLGAPATPEQLTRARALFARALETPGGLRIQTIHAFCERLIARFPLEAGVAPGFVVAEDGEAAAMLREAWAGLTEGPGGEAVLRFAARFSADQMDDLAKALIARRAEAGAAIARAGGLDAAMAAIRARHGAAGTREEVLAGLTADVDWAQIEAAAHALSGSSANDQKLGRKLEAAASTRDVEALCAAMHTGDHRPISQVPTKAARQAHAWLDRMFSEAGQLGVVCRGFAALRAAERAEASCAALALAQAAGARYEAAKTARGALDFDDLIEAARQLLTERAAAAWVLYRLDGRLMHMLVDEGQDTSPSQWAVLEPIQAEFFAGAGAREIARTVFAVGDPKQSIYSFQGADPAKFREEGRRLSLRTPAFIAPGLTVSFRSASQVLAAVDAVFKDMGDGGIDDPFDDVEHVAARTQEGGCVEVWAPAPAPSLPDPRPWDAPRDAERADDATAALARAVAERIVGMIAAREGVWDGPRGARRLRPVRPGDFLILVQSRGACFAHVLKALKRAGLPVAGADRMVLREDIAVQDLLACVRAALDPGDDLSLACVLKGPFVGLIDDDLDLFPLAARRTRVERLIERLEAATAPRFVRARDFVRGLFAAAGANAFDFLSSILDGLDGDGVSGWTRLFARLGSEARDPVEELLLRALALGREGPSDLQRFLAAVEADDAAVKRELEGAGDAVRVMTVHGAKGLEAPVVFLPDAAAAPKAGEGGLFFDAFGPIYAPSKAEDDQVSAEAREAARKRADAERLRLLYVAMTRAQDRLIVCGAMRRSAKGGSLPAESWLARVQASLAAIADPIETPFGPGLRIGAPIMAPEAHTPAPAVTALPDWAARPAEQAAAATRLRASGVKAGPRFAAGEGRSAAARGVLIHALLHRLPETPAALRRERALRFLKPHALAPHEGEALIEEALRVIETPAFAPLFGPGSRGEAPIAGVVSGRPVFGQADRLIIAPDHALIVDFKSDAAPSAEPPAAYLRQMALYQAVIAAALPDRPVRCALLWTAIPRLDGLAQDKLDLSLGDLR